MADANEIAIDQPTDLRQYADFLRLVNPEDRDFFAEHFLDSDSDDDDDLFGSEDVNFIPIESITNRDRDA